MSNVTRLGCGQNYKEILNSHFTLQFKRVAICVAKIFLKHTIYIFNVHIVKVINDYKRNIVLHVSLGRPPFRKSGKKRCCL